MGKILILGATGLLGVPLSNFLAQQGYNVIRHGFRSKADYQADLRKQDETNRLLNIISPDCVINLTALTDVDLCEENPHMAYMINIRPVENLLTWLMKHSETKLIHLSTDQIYDGNGPHKEDDIYIRNTYALTKYCSEHIALRANACVLRTNFFGKSQTPDRYSFSDWLVNSLIQKKPIKLFTDVFFSPLSIATLQRIISLIIDKYKSGVFNLGSHDGMSKRDFGFMLANYLDLDFENVTETLSTGIELKAPRPLDMRMDSTLFEMTFDVKLPTLAEEIKLIRRDYEK